MPPADALGRGWAERAACRDMDTDLFYSEQPGSHQYQARAVCARCPVIVECLDWVMGVEEGLNRTVRHGVLGGQTPSGRANLQRDRDRAAAQGRSLDLSEADIRALATARRISPPRPAAAGSQQPTAPRLFEPPAVGTRWRTRDAREGDRVVVVLDVVDDHVLVQRVPPLGAPRTTLQGRRSRLTVAGFEAKFTPETTDPDAP